MKGVKALDTQISGRREFQAEKNSSCKSPATGVDLASSNTERKPERMEGRGTDEARASERAPQAFPLNPRGSNYRVLFSGIILNFKESSGLFTLITDYGEQRW